MPLTGAGIGRPGFAARHLLARATRIVGALDERWPAVIDGRDSKGLDIYARRDQNITDQSVRGILKLNMSSVLSLLSPCRE